MRDASIDSRIGLPVNFISRLGVVALTLIHDSARDGSTLTINNPATHMEPLDFVRGPCPSVDPGAGKGTELLVRGVRQL